MCASDAAARTHLNLGTTTAIPIGLLFAMPIFPPTLARSKAAMLICLLFCVTLSIGALGANYFFPFGLDYGEAPLLDQAERLLSAGTLYSPNLQSPPYVIANYPPVYPSFIAAIHLLTGAPLLPIGRSVSLAATLFNGVLIGAFAKKLTHKWLAAIAAALLFWGHPHVAVWGSFARVDMLALTFSLFGLWLLVSGDDSWKSMLAASTLLVAAIFTRQSSLLAAPVAAFCLLWGSDRRKALALAGIVAFLTLAVFLILNTASQGGFYLHTIVANVNAFEPGRALAMWKQFLFIWPVVIPIALSAAIQITSPLRLLGRTNSSKSTSLHSKAGFIQRRYIARKYISRLRMGMNPAESTSRSKSQAKAGFIQRHYVTRTLMSRRIMPEQPVSVQSPLSTALFVFLLAALAGSFTVGKVGSNVNYFLETIAALSIWAGCALGGGPHIPKQSTTIPSGSGSEVQKAPGAPAAWLAALNTIWVIVILLSLNLPAIARQWQKVDRYRTLFQQVQSAAAQGIVLSDDYLDWALKAGQPIYFQPFEFTQLALAGVWDDTALAAAVENQQFSLILIGGNTLDKPCCWPPKVSDAIRQNYQTQPGDGWIACTPKPK